MAERQKSQSAFLIYPGISQQTNKQTKTPTPKCTYRYIYICFVCVIMGTSQTKEDKDQQFCNSTENTNFSGQIFSEEEENIV